jgi:hypothetical protein
MIRDRNYGLQERLTQTVTVVYCKDSAWLPHAGRGQTVGYCKQQVIIVPFSFAHSEFDAGESTRAIEPRVFATRARKMIRVKIIRQYDEN